MPGRRLREVRADRALRAFQKAGYVIARVVGSHIYWCVKAVDVRGIRGSDLMVQDIEYIIVIHPAEEGGFWSEVPSLPGAGSQGESVDETVTKTKESIEAVLEVMKDRGDPVVPPNDIIVKVHVAA